MSTAARISPLGYYLKLREILDILNGSYNLGIQGPPWFPMGTSYMMKVDCTSDPTYHLESRAQRQNRLDDLHDGRFQVTPSL